MHFKILYFYLGGLNLTVVFGQLCEIFLSDSVHTEIIVMYYYYAICTDNY